MHRQSDMDKMSNIDAVSTHPCHRLSIPSARVFWCRHCMQQFEDPISRWRHSKTCKPSKCPYNMSQKVDKEADALRLATGGEILLRPKTEPTSDECSKNLPFQCYICKKAFDSLQRMRMHVRYPCNRVGDVQSPPLEAEDEYIVSTRKKETDWQTKFNKFCSGEFQGGSSVPVHVIPVETCETDVSTSSCSFYPGTVGQNVNEEHLFVTGDEQVIQAEHDQPDIMNVCETVISSSPDETLPANQEKVITVQGIDVFGTNDELYLSELLMQLSRGGFLFQNDANKDETQHNSGEQAQQVEVVIHRQDDSAGQHKGDIQVVIEQEQIPQYVHNQNDTEVEIAESDKLEAVRTGEECTVGFTNTAKTNQLRILAAVTQDDLNQIEQNQQIVVNHMSSTEGVYNHKNLNYNSGALTTSEQTHVDQNPDDFVSNQLSLLASVTSERLQSVKTEKTEPCLVQNNVPSIQQGTLSSNVIATQDINVSTKNNVRQQDVGNVGSATHSSASQYDVLPVTNSNAAVLNNQVYQGESIIITNEESQKRRLCNYEESVNTNKKHKSEPVL